MKALNKFNLNQSLQISIELIIYKNALIFLILYLDN
jgi:hypothetical protein